MAEMQTAASSRAAQLKARVAAKRDALKTNKQEKQIAEEKTTESWSGLRIANRCVRQEKWDLSMQGKKLMQLGAFGADPLGRDQVVIGVLCSTELGPRRSLDGGKEFAQWTLTDLDAQSPQQATLVLMGRALEHWSRKEGLGRAQAAAGSIMAVLNPTMTGRYNTIRINFDTQLIKLGTCPAFAQCTAKNGDGMPCREPYNKEGGCDYCALHQNMGHGVRQHNRLPTATQTHSRSSATLPAGSRPVASPIGASGPAPPSASALLILERAEAELEALVGGAQKAETLRILHDLNAAKMDGATLKCSTKLYERIGSLAQASDNVGTLAKSLRRKWRILMDDASRAAGESGLHRDEQHIAKRPRLG